MKFWDLLFKRYASPFILLDELIASGDFFEWIIEFIEQENEQQLYEVWLHKVTEQGYNEYKQWVKDHTEKVTEQELETTILQSSYILNNFNPNGGETG